MSIVPLLLLAASANVVNYDCTLEAPKALNRTGGAVSLMPMGFPEGSDWSFRVAVTTKSDRIEAEVIWPKNPIQIAGKYAALTTAKGSVAFVAASAGSCMFTEAGCITVVQLVDQPDGSAQIVLMPTALATDTAKDTRKPFIVLAQGTCKRSEKSS